MQTLSSPLPVSAWGRYACRYQCHRRSRSKKSQPQPLFPHQNKSRGGLLAKPSPASTPLLRRGPQTMTRLQMLNETIKDVQDSIEKGVPVGPDIFSSLLETCSQMSAFQQGIQVHSLVPPRLLRKTPSLSAKLLRFYAVCGRLEDAHKLFDEMAQPPSVFAWNSLISGYVEQGHHEDAMALYYQMDEMGVEPDNFTFPRVLKACAGIGSLQRGEDVHRHIIRCGYGGDQFIMNALIDMYAKCGEIVKARRLFERMPERDIVSWNTMLVGYIRHGCLDFAASVIRLMVSKGFEPDSVGISAMLSGCASASRSYGLWMGTQIHGRVIRQGNDLELSVSNSLIDMYAKLGCTSSARAVFDQLREKDIVSWNSIIYAYGKKDVEQAFAMFKRMIEYGIAPDSITFVALLSACVGDSASSRCLVDEGRYFFNLMLKRYGIQPRIEHYACMVNVLGRAGLIDEAYKMITKQMRPSLEPGPSIWGALLFACSIHGNVDVGEIAADMLFELEPDNLENFNLLLQIYCGAERWDDAERVREMIRERGL
ncbi:pentatricopeptide repeat-containing protein At4g25270, chloroplastic-like [Nymphaea colorata]|nr:pentatricopeptide repeat-containing protein At4g25270, chloroplastic-like [Nymphaea colorata]